MDQESVDQLKKAAERSRHYYDSHPKLRRRGIEADRLVRQALWYTGLIIYSSIGLIIMILLWFIYRNIKHRNQ